MGTSFNFAQEVRASAGLRQKVTSDTGTIFAELYVRDPDWKVATVSGRENVIVGLVMRRGLGLAFT
jgi:stress response protein SCP2